MSLLTNPIPFPSLHIMILSGAFLPSPLVPLLISLYLTLPSPLDPKDDLSRGRRFGQLKSLLIISQIKTMSDDRIHIHLP